MSTPWPRSPNITANRKGKVMMVYGAGDEEVVTQASCEGRVVWQVKQHMSVTIQSMSKQTDNG